MQVVGVDFGTTNIRIATWDSERPEVIPESRLIGQGDASTMPAVIAFQRQPDGYVTTFVGEDADILEDVSGTDDRPETVVVRNIKRWALSDDPYVEWNLKSRGTLKEDWWNPETRCVEALGQVLPVQDIVRKILAEAFRRAGITGPFQWRAGCPVHAGLGYRSMLAEVLSEFGGENKVSYVVEEPVLFLALAHRMGQLTPGSYMVYDVGGGSFDCALAEVGTDGEMTVYAAQGDPTLGGVLIEELLKEKLGYTGSAISMRLAKEQVSPSNPSLALGDGISLGWSDVEEVLKKRQFLGWTLAAMREAYIVAKVLWKPEEGAPPIGAIPSCRLGDMPTAFRKDLHSIFLTGGPTKSPYFRDRLTETFGDQVVPTEEVVPQNVPDPELTGLSIGACYMFDDENRRPLYVSRLPARVTLQDTSTGHPPVEYTPYQHFVPNFNPAKPFISAQLLARPGNEAEYVLTVTDVDGEVLGRQIVDFSRGRVLRGETRSPQLVIDTLGQVGIKSNRKSWVEIEAPPWQTDRQRKVIEEIFEQQQQYEQSEGIRTDAILNDLWHWQS
jgi:hypothetical protein